MLSQLSYASIPVELSTTELLYHNKIQRELYASVAQLVEQRTENPRVVGSIPTGGTNADLAHLVERRLAKAKVAGSSPVIRSKHGYENIRARFFLW